MKRQISSIFMLLVLTPHPPSAEAQTRSLGFDISAWQGNWTSTMWATAKRSPSQTVNGIAGDGRDFVFLRASRGGTTGVYNQSDPNNNLGGNTLSQRYDDPYFVQNITRATAAGLFAGSYHFARPDIISTTLNSGGIANTGEDEANHYIQMAGAWMRPGYLMPVFDLEAGDGIRTDNAIAQFSLDFSNRIFAVMGIRPMMYINGNYAQNVIGGASSTLRNQVVQAFPQLWIARYPNETNPSSINVQTSAPNASFTNLYGPWDDFGNPQPWTFWQHTANGRLNASGANAAIDLNVANGGIEFVKDQLVPAILVGDSNVDWSTLSAWNSGQTPVAPVQGPGQPARIGTLVLPAVRLPGSNDTVILDRTTANPTVTLSTGTHNIRKLITRETLNLTGGSLNINYEPSADSTPFAARFSSNVTLSGTASLSVHTVQVDSSQVFALSGGSVTFSRIQLQPGVTAAARLNIAGNVALSPLIGATATISPMTGTGATGVVDLSAGQRTLTVNDGAALVDLSIDVPIQNGGLTKRGSGTLRLNAANVYSGPTALEQGTTIVRVASLAHRPILGGGSFTPGGADLRGGTLIFDYSGTTSPATQVVSILSAGFASNFTTGLIFTTLPDDPSIGIGMNDDGVSQIRLMRALYGDANLDSVVDFTDLLALARTFNQPGTWDAGDFNYDGQVNFADLIALSRNFSRTLTAAGPANSGVGLVTGSFEGDWNLALSLVPEPATMGLLGCFGTLVLARRRPQQV
jgi:autotransporter-associated beta strand protein